MIKVLITGQNSYVGNSFKNWIEKKHYDEIQVDNVGMRDGEWRKTDFKDYDVILHVAGIAHIRETQKNRGHYYKINTDLTKEVAFKAKSEGVKHFVFISSMSVYGLITGKITRETKTSPNSAYGKSKLEAEHILQKLKDDTFNVAIVRPPMIYGYNCKGNYSRLVKLTLKSPFFPYVKNKRSMIFIYNLTEFLKIIIERKMEGTFFPQNSHYVCTSEMVKLIADRHNKRMFFINLIGFTPIFKHFKTSSKLFGDLIYDIEMSTIEYNYEMYSFEDSISEENHI